MSIEERIKRLLNPIIEKTKRDYEDTLNELRSKFCMGNRLKGGLYMEYISRKLHDFVVELSEIITAKITENIINKNIYITGKSIAAMKAHFQQSIQDFVFSSYENFAKAGNTSMPSFQIASKEQQSKLTEAIKEQILNIEESLNFYKKKILKDTVLKYLFNNRLKVALIIIVSMYEKISHFLSMAYSMIKN